MRELADSRCVTGLLAILLAPFALASARYRDEIAGMRQGLDAASGGLSQLVVQRETAVVLAILVIALALGTLRAVGTERAAPATVRAVQAALVVAVVASWVALHAALGPMHELMDKLR
ncbi:MAG: hypothetical protein JWM98_532 [Thermoleophilia bacterium]|nr:hypothetical protein [Thermoleophilia bacterium]